MRTQRISVTLPVQVVMDIEITPGSTESDIHFLALAKLKECFDWGISLYKEECEPESTKNTLRTDFYIWYDNGKFADKNRVG